MTSIPGSHIADDELVSALDEEMPPRRRNQIDHHLAWCGECRRRQAELREALQSPTRDEDGASGAPRFDAVANRERLVVALSAAEARRFTPALALAVAASLVVAIAWASLPRRGAPPAAAVMLPVPALTPGAVADLTEAQLCAGERPSREVSPQARRQVLRAYGVEQVSDHAYELDALITPELGGTAEPANLWPQMYDSPVWNARVKDQLEDLLSDMVCRHEITLTQAQRDIASNWVAAYKRYFKSETPLPSRVASLDARLR